MERRQAKAAGLRFYDNGKVCPAAHESTVRYTVTGKCLECCKLERVRFREQRRSEAMIRSASSVTKPIDATRRIARAAGLIFYDNGRKCPRDHASTVRYVVSGKCLQCSRMETARYSIGRSAYRAAHALEIRAKVRQWRADNPERRKELDADYRERHREDLKARNVLYRKTHPTPLIDRRVRENMRRTKKKAASGSFTAGDVLALMKEQRGKCAYCRVPLKKFGYQIDHILPIRLYGHSNRSNLQLLCGPCNWSKQGRHPIEFARTRGLLL